MPPSPPSDTLPVVSLQRRLLGLLMFPLALFPVLALVSYDWHAVSALCLPPAPSSANFFGLAGNSFAYAGYQLVGLAVWGVPVLFMVFGLLLLTGRTLHPGRRTIALACVLFAGTCLMQLAGFSPAVREMLQRLNIAPNAGGAVGYLVMTRGLARYLSPFGAGMVMASFLFVAILFTIGMHNLVALFARLTAWAADRDAARVQAETAEARDNAIASALAVADDAKAQRLREKERIAAERAAAKAKREAARAELARQREAAREARLAEKESKRLAREAEDPARAAARERLRKIHEQELADLRAKRGEESRDFLPARGEAPKKPDFALDATPPPPSAPAVKPMRTVKAPAAEPAPAPAEPVEDKGPYVLPPVTLLNEVPAEEAGGEDTSAMAQRLIDTLKVFDVNAQLAYFVAGPVVTQYALSLDLGTRVEKVAALQRNIQMALQATSLRIEAPIPGKNAVGIEVPNAKPASVHFRAVLEGATWQKNSAAKFQLPLLLGKDAAGNDLVADLAKLPHLLVAGATGQGKSVCLNSIINGLLMCRTPEQLKLIMVDPKRVEFTSYNRLPHLLVPIINDTKKVVFALRSAVVEMDKRLKMFARAKCRNIVDFNGRKTMSQPDMFGGGDEVLGEDADMPRTLPYIVIIIDEVADIMQAAKKEVEPVIARLTALARATGIHLILATQRPSTDVITGVIKGNIPGRIAFKTSSSIDSRTILDATGSELLIGKGDMLFKMADGRLLRAQGSFLSDEEITRIVNFIGEHASVQFDEKLTKRLERIKEAEPEDEDDLGDDEDAPGEEAAGGAPAASAAAGATESKEDQLYRRALEVLAVSRRASVSLLQRKMGIGYNHAARLIDRLEENGIIGPARAGAGAREVLVDPETLLQPAAAEPAPDAPAAEGGEVPPPAEEPVPPPSAEDDPLGTTL